MKIMHVFRSPVGGLFRHVSDLAREQRILGHDVGVICDRETGGAAADKSLAALERVCNLGLTRIAIGTLPGIADFTALRAMKKIVAASGARVIHGHGAKGGVYARLTGRKLGLASAYSPHGGSLHYEWLNLPGAAFLSAERLLRFSNSGIIFVCDFEKHLFEHKIGIGKCKNAVIYNGLQPQEFAMRELSANAADFLFVGEMRRLKGVDVLLDALAQARKTQPFTLNLVGDGRDLAKIKARAENLGIAGATFFLGRKTIGEALPLGRVLVLPSRHESFPYVVLEAIAARVPIIASRVGGIPEILAENQLVTAGDAKDLAQAMVEAALHPTDRVSVAELQIKAAQLFTVRRMAERTLAFYNLLH